MENEQTSCPTCGQPLQQTDPDVSSVIELANLVHNTIRPSRTKNNTVYISPQASKKIKARLKTWTLDELKKAILKFSGNRWRMEFNRTKSLDWFFRNDAQIETFLQLEQDLNESNLTKEIFTIGNKEYSLEEINEAEKKGELFYDRKEKKYFQAQR